MSVQDAPGLGGDAPGRTEASQSVLSGGNVRKVFTRLLFSSSSVIHRFPDDSDSA